MCRSPDGEEFSRLLESLIPLFEHLPHARHSERGPRWKEAEKEFLHLSSSLMVQLLLLSLENVCRFLWRQLPRLLGDHLPAKSLLISLTSGPKLGWNKITIVFLNFLGESALKAKAGLSIIQETCISVTYFCTFALVCEHTLMSDKMCAGFNMRTSQMKGSLLRESFGWACDSCALSTSWGWKQIKK